MVLFGEALVLGSANAPMLTLTEPLSFWGGYDSILGKIIDERHPQFGQSLAGRIIVMTHAKGSSSSSSVLAEALRTGTGPQGIILRERDLILCIGAIVAKELYNTGIPVLVLDYDSFETVAQSSGTISIETNSDTMEACLTVIGSSANTSDVLP